MPVYLIKNKYPVYKGKKTAETKYRKELSQKIIAKFGKASFKEPKLVREVLTFSLEYFISEFRAICLTETSVRFYQNVLRLHENATELAHLYKEPEYPKEIGEYYIAKYRRILKFILETGCEVKMVTNEISRQKVEILLDDLIFLGEMILTCVDIFAEQTMIEDVIEVSFDKNELYYFTRNHHYEFIFEYIIEQFGSYLEKPIVDNNGFDDFKNALQNCFGIKYENISHIIASIEQELKPKGGTVVGVGWETWTLNLHKLYNVPLDAAEQFFRGLTLDKTNKMSLLDLACKPYNLNRYLYKPILIWNINGADFSLLVHSAWAETIIQYTTNAIPWGKAPTEWMQNKHFKHYVNRKEDEHDKWLDDAVEEKCTNLNMLYDRNVKFLNTVNGTVRIDGEGLGEIDFIVISEKTKKILITDCKHLVSRYDIVNQRNDFNAFSIGSKKNKSYNQTITNKLIWYNQNKNLVEEHFRIKYNNPSISLKNYIFEGIFIVNTPTFYMYNSEYRIYTLKQIEDVFLGKFIDPVFTIFSEDEDCHKMLKVTYPYFTKPDYIEFNPFNE